MKNNLYEIKLIIRDILSENKNYNLQVIDRNGEKVDWDDDMEKSLNNFIEDDNVIKTKEGYKTQDAQYGNLLPTKNDLRKYFYKEYIKNL